MRLAVELGEMRIGVLEGDRRTFDFSPEADAVDVLGVNSTALSVAIPLTMARRRDHAARRRNWFAELLPEGDQYDFMLAQAGLRGADVPAFLARYGRDVAGALQIWNLDDPTEPRTPGLRQLSGREVRGMLEDPMAAPLANDPRAGRSSLGGVQPKVVLTLAENGWAQALGGYPTTHIVKPMLPGANASVIYDEEFGSRLARRMGLSGFATWIDDFADLPALVIERFDRRNGARVHQEDFNQALGAAGSQKYQEIDGVVSLKRIAEVLTRHAPASELRALARTVVLAVGIGNLDMHAKNLGLLHPPEGGVLLTPAYDNVPQAHRSSDGRLALAVNGKYRHAEITQDDLRTEFATWGIRRGSAIMLDAIAELEAIVHEEAPLAGAARSVQSNVKAFVENLAAGAPVGGR